MTNVPDRVQIQDFGLCRSTAHLDQPGEHLDEGNLHCCSASRASLSLPVAICVLLILLFPTQVVTHGRSLLFSIAGCSALAVRASYCDQSYINHPLGRVSVRFYLLLLL